MIPIPLSGRHGVALRSAWTEADDELERRDVEVDGTYVGSIVYVKRHLKSGGTQYGWRPAKAARNSKLLTMSEAADRVLSHLPLYTLTERTGT